MRIKNPTILATLLKFAKCSSAGYENDDIAREAFLNLGIQHRLYLSGDSTQVFVGIHKCDKIIVITFRGTEPTKAQDILADVNFKKIQYAVGMVHEGFSKALDEIFDLLLVFLTRAEYTGYKLQINGHSLGGALALFCAVRLKLEHSFNDVEVVTFGQPKVGDNVFIKKVEELLGENYIRVVNDEDIIPKLPTKLKMGFDHNGTVYFINDQSEMLKVDKDFQWKSNLAEGILDIIKAFATKDKDEKQEIWVNLFKEEGTDHSIDEYIKSLETTLLNIQNHSEVLS